MQNLLLFFLNQNRLLKNNIFLKLFVYFCLQIVNK